MEEIEEAFDGRRRVLLVDPPLARRLFQSPALALPWAAVRVWVSSQWILLGLEDLPGLDGTVSAGLLAAWRASVDAPRGPAGTDDWLRDTMRWLLEHHAEGWLPAFVAVAELAVGVALFLGALVGLAAAAGLAIYWLRSVLLIGSTVNVLVLPVSVLLLLAWKTAGRLGLDRFILRRFGAPWWDAPALRPITPMGHDP